MPSRFYASVSNTRGNEVTASGGSRGQSAHIRGRNAGIRVESRPSGHGNGEQDAFMVFATGGSYGSAHQVLIGTLTDTPGGPTFEAADISIKRAMGEASRQGFAEGFAAGERSMSEADRTPADTVTIMNAVYTRDEAERMLHKFANAPRSTSIASLERAVGVESGRWASSPGYQDTVWWDGTTTTWVEHLRELVFQCR